jgi:hypothetical protein
MAKTTRFGKFIILADVISFDDDISQVYSSRGGVLAPFWGGAWKAD